MGTPGTGANTQIQTHIQSGETKGSSLEDSSVIMEKLLKEDKRIAEDSDLLCDLRHVSLASLGFISPGGRRRRLG